MAVATGECTHQTAQHTVTLALLLWQQPHFYAERGQDVVGKVVVRSAVGLACAPEQDDLQTAPTADYLKVRGFLS